MGSGASCPATGDRQGACCRAIGIASSSRPARLCLENGRGFRAGIIGSLVAGVLLLVAFLVRERTAKSPMIDLALFRARGLSIANAVGFLMSLGLTFAPLSEAVMSAITGNRQGQASSVYNTIRELGGVFGIAVLGAIFQHIVVLPVHFVDGFRVALLAGAGAVALGVVIALAMPRRAPLANERAERAAGAAQRTTG
ncbi:MAG TPA: hypothetical protein VHB98_07780, partial [Chloroflexota bacterium]|nr:hypothetical protein [Chloroflexota bacterium]